MHNLRRHTNGFTKGWMWVDGFANVYRVRPHLDSQRNLPNPVVRMGAGHAAAQYLAVSVRFARSNRVGLQTLKILSRYKRIEHLRP